MTEQSHQSGTLSSSQNHIFKSFRSFEEEIVIKINHYRLKMNVLCKEFNDFVESEANNKKDCIITFKELNITLPYGSEETIERLSSYLKSLSEAKLAIPDLSNSTFLNQLFTRSFGPYIDFHQGLFLRDIELDQRLHKELPSLNYQGIYLHDIQSQQQYVDQLLFFMILQEFVLLTAAQDHLESEQLKIEVYSNEFPQQVSFLNPDFNTITVYINDKTNCVYLLFLTDVLELIQPQDGGQFVRTDKEFRKKSIPEGQKSVMNRTAPPKYNNMKYSKPDVNIFVVRDFLKKLDTDGDDKITPEDVLKVIKRKSLAISEEVVQQMFEEIYEKRSLKSEAFRRFPIDEHEVYHAIRYKQKKGSDAAKTWTSFSRPYRETWLSLFEVVGVDIPKYSVPKLEPQPILTNHEAQKFTFKPQIKKRVQSGLKVQDQKPPVYKNPYFPEADIIIQNTQRINELYIDNQKPKVAKPEEAFEKVVNRKIKEYDKNQEYQTIEFNTKDYFKEAMRLSENPYQYQKKDRNPILSYIPVDYNQIYGNAKKTQEEKKNFESTHRDSFSESRVQLGSEESLNAQLGTTKKALANYNFESEPNTKNRISSKPQSRPRSMGGPTITFDPIGTINRISKSRPQSQIPSIYGSERKTVLSNTQKEKKVDIKTHDGTRPVFITNFKIHNSKSMKMLAAKNESNKGPYNPPKSYQFREFNDPEQKQQFILSWHPEIQNWVKNEEEWDRRPQEVLLKEAQQNYEQLMKKLGRQKNNNDWIKYYKLASRDRNIADHKLPQFNEKGDYLDGFMRQGGFLRGEVDFEVPFQLFHRSLRKTDKNLFMGDQAPSN